MEQKLDREKVLAAIAAIRKVVTVGIATFDFAETMQSVSGAPRNEPMARMKALHGIALTLCEGVDELSDEQLAERMVSLDRTLAQMEGEAEQNAANKLN